MTNRTFTRRHLLAASAALPALLVACGKDGQPTATATTGAPSTPAGASPSSAATSAAPVTLAPTPSCVDDDDVTPAQTEGPYFSPGSPERSNLRADVSGGTTMVLSGTVVTTACAPVNRALVELWHADANGEYDNSGYRLRGHVFTDSAGRFSFTTVVPGIYTGRTRHLHLKVQAPNGPVLTTQLYFPGEAGNAADNIYDQALEMTVTQSGGTTQGSYGFVVAT